MPFTERFGALQQGTVDGQDNGASLTYNACLFEAQRYMTLTNHTYVMGAVAVSKRFWDRLSPETQEVISETAREVAVDQIAASRAATEGFIAKIEVAGIEVIRPDADAMNSFVEAGHEAWDQLLPVYGEERVSVLRQEVDAVKGP